MLFLGLKFFHNMQDAEDFAQKVFLRAFRKLASFRGQVPFGAWLYRLAFNLAVNDYHVSRRRLSEVELGEMRLTDTGPTPEALYQRGERQRGLAQVLESLPESFALVIRMHYYDEMTYPQISQATGLPVNTIKSHVFRAKRLIRRRMERMEGAQGRAREATS